MANLNKDQIVRCCGQNIRRYKMNWVATYLESKYGNHFFAKFIVSTCIVCFINYFSFKIRYLYARSIIRYFIPVQLRLSFFPTFENIFSRKLVKNGETV